MPAASSSSKKGPPKRVALFYYTQRQKYACIWHLSQTAQSEGGYAWELLNNLLSQQFTGLAKSSGISHLGVPQSFQYCLSPS